MFDALSYFRSFAKSLQFLGGDLAPILLRILPHVFRRILKLLNTSSKDEVETGLDRIVIIIEKDLLRHTKSMPDAMKKALAENYVAILRLMIYNKLNLQLEGA